MPLDKPTVFQPRLPSELKMYVLHIKNLHVDVHSSFIYICPYLEVIKMSCSVWVGKCIQIDNGISLASK